MKAQDWLTRADELRELAGRTKYRAVRAALLDMAATFDSQAANLTKLALRLRTTPDGLRSPRCPNVAD